MSPKNERAWSTTMAVARSGVCLQAEKASFRLGDVRRKKNG